MLKQDSARGKASSKGMVLNAALNHCSFLFIFNATLMVETELIYIQFVVVIYLIIFLLIEGYFHLDGRAK